MTKPIKKLLQHKSLLFLGVLYTVIITVAFLSPATEIPETNIPLLDKIAHVSIHSVLFFIWLTIGVIHDLSHSILKIIFVTLIACFIYGISIEVVQHYFTRSRAFDWYDIIANEIGCLIGLCFYWIVRKI